MFKPAHQRSKPYHFYKCSFPHKQSTSRNTILIFWWRGFTTLNSMEIKTIHINSRWMVIQYITVSLGKCNFWWISSYLKLDWAKSIKLMKRSKIGYFCFPAAALNLHLPVPAINLFLPALVLNLCLSALRFTVKVCYSYGVYLFKLCIYLYVFT